MFFCFRVSESEFWPEISSHHSGLPPQQTGTQSVQKEIHKGPCSSLFCLCSVFTLYSVSILSLFCLYSSVLSLGVSAGAERSSGEKEEDQWSVSRAAGGDVTLLADTNSFHSSAPRKEFYFERNMKWRKQTGFVIVEEKRMKRRKRLSNEESALKHLSRVPEMRRRN